jgi:hypothetical protein
MTRPNPRATRFGRAVVVAVGLASVAADCQQCQPPAAPNRGNVDRVADVILVDGADGHAYAITANPELEHLRVLDLTDGAFVTGPNRFFPLSIPTGPETRALALAVVRNADDTTSTDVRFAYALDSADDVVQVFTLPAAGDDGAVVPFVVVDRVPTGRGPVDLAALGTAGVTTIAVALPPTATSDGALQLVDRAADGSIVDDVIVPLGPGSQPAAVVADPFGRAFVVADAALSLLHVVERDKDGRYALVRDLDVGGPTHGLGAGVVDVGDGLAPVVLALRADTAAAVAVRLFRPGFREDRFAVLGGTALPSPGVTALVVDARPGTGDAAAPVTVCCRGLDDDRLAAGEATAAFAAVHQANGQLVYLQLAAAHIDGLALAPGRRVVRLVDDDGAAPAPPEGVDVNADPTLWVPAAGGEERRPIVAFAAVDDLGTPPFVPLGEPGRILDLQWEDDLPGLLQVRGALDATTPTFVAVVDVAARDARVGDIARLEPEPAPAGCEPATRAVIVAVVGAAVTFAVDDTGDDPAADDPAGDDPATAPAVTTTTLDACLRSAAAVRLTVEAQGAFVVRDARGYVARLQPVSPGATPSPAEATALSLGGAQLSVTTPAGAPVPGSTLLVPVDPHLQTLGLDLSTPSARGGFGDAGLVPTGLAGATITIPDAASDDVAAVLEARRMVITTAGDIGGLPLVLTCDEAETSTLRVESFR